MGYKRLILGKKGEDIAARFLQGKGYRIIGKNYKTCLGEVDLIANEKGVFCFVEVRTKSSDGFCIPEETINYRKKRQISKAALSYIKSHQLEDRPARFDIITILIKKDGALKIEHIKNAFELDPRYTY